MELEEYDYVLDMIMNNYYVSFWVKRAKTKGVNVVMIKFAFAKKTKYY